MGIEKFRTINVTFSESDFELLKKMKNDCGLSSWEEFIFLSARYHQRYSKVLNLKPKKLKRSVE